MGTTMVFKRHEKKFMLNEAQYKQLKALLNDYTEEDTYGQYTICSIYFDTEDYKLIRHSISKPKFKEKLRLRSYGTPNEDSKVYLELKKKLAGITYKRRISLPLKEMNLFLQNSVIPNEQGQISNEIKYFIEQNSPVPKVMICYDRIALTGRADPSLRITFDKNIRFRTNELYLAKGDKGRLLLPQNNYIMEVKTVGSIPYWLTKQLSQVQAYNTSFSKYGSVYQQHLALKGEQKYA